MQVIFYAFDELKCYKCQRSSKLSYAEMHTCIHNSSCLIPFAHPRSLFLNSHSLLSPICLPLVLLQLLFCSSVKRFLFLSGLHLFRSPPTPNADTAEGISHSQSAFFPPLQLSPYLSLSICVFTSRPLNPLPSLSLHAQMAHFAHYGSIRHFALWKG